MSTPFEIRRATLADAVAIAALSGELGYPATAQQMTERLAALLSRATQFIAVAATPDGNALAWIAAERRLLLEYGDRIEIVGLVVGMAARRGGVGKALVDAVEAWTREQGLTIVGVRSNAARVESHPFYERLGFIRRKTQHSYEKILGD